MARSFASISLHSLRSLALAAVFVALNMVAQADTCGSLDRLVIALRLTRVLYPELMHRESSISLSAGHGNPLNTPTNGTDIGLAIDKNVGPTAAGSKPRSDNTPQLLPGEADGSELPLYLDFDFAEGTGTAAIHVVCRPLKFINNKSSKQIQDARKVIDSHPEWTDEQDLDAATKLGMRFGPKRKNDVLQLIPLKELMAFYGPLRIQKAFFSVTGTKQPGSSFADLTWFITVDRVGTEKTLQIMVEPFHGKIIAISQ
jgi:hypothetical protein